eukprot:UN05122
MTLIFYIIVSRYSLYLPPPHTQIYGYEKQRLQLLSEFSHEQRTDLHLILKHKSAVIIMEKAL